MHDVDGGARGTVETSKAAAPPTGRSMPASWTMLVRSSARDGPTLDLRTSRSMSADMPSTVASGFDLPRTLARSPRRSRGVLPRWWLCREAIVGRSATQSTATPASRRQGGLWPAPAPQLVSWSVRLRRPCGGVRGAAGWAFREQARDRQRAPRRLAPARDRWLRVQRPARRHLTDRRSI